MAVCPNCNVENDPSNVQCTICKTSLGALLVADASQNFKWFAISAFVALGAILPCILLELHTATFVIAMFYGPVLASYFARTNVVWATALGGVTTFALVTFIAMLDKEGRARAMLTQLAGSKSEDHLLGGFALVLGLILAVVCVLPVALTGASVGEHLSVRRRRKPS